MGHVRHLYVHLPFCAHRCGYCDFVTVVGKTGQHAAYVDALLAELELERALLAGDVATVFLGGGTPTFTEPAELERLLAALPRAEEVTVEANPETVTAELAALLRANGVTRVSLGVQTFRPHLLHVLERQASPDDVRRAVRLLREAGFDNVSFDLVYGIPGQTVADLDADLADALALEPEHLSCYELEAKPGTRFTFAHGGELARQADAMEGYFEQVVDTLTAAGYRWYETANFCLARRERGRARPPRAPQPRLLVRARLPRARDRCRVDGVGRAQAQPAEPVALRRGARGGRCHRRASWSPSTARPTCASCCSSASDWTSPSRSSTLRLRWTRDALARLVELDLVELSANGRGEELRLTRRGRFLGGGVTAELLVLAAG